MKKLLLILHLLFFVSYAQLHAQKIRFTDSSNKWLINSSWMTGQSFFVRKYSGDTIINGYSYLISDFGFIREDTISNRVYAKDFKGYPTSIADTTEIVLYDYNLEVGDSMSYNYSNSIDQWKYIVVSKDSTYIDNIKYKVWYVNNLSSNTSNQNFTIIEGIGTLCGPAFAAFPYTFENYLAMYCFENHSSHPQLQPSITFSYFNPFFLFDNVNSCNLSVNNITAHQSITISPNPANENSRIIFPYIMQSGKLSITNMFGQPVVSYNIKNEEQVYIGRYLNSSGIYFYIVTDLINNKTFSGKFIFQ